MEVTTRLDQHHPLGGFKGEASAEKGDFRGKFLFPILWAGSTIGVFATSLISQDV